MSSRHSPLLPTTIWPCKPTASFKRLTVHHLTLSTATALLSSPSSTDSKGETLFSYTHRIFAHILEDGRTHSQELASGETWESYTRETFEAYLWAADVFIAIGSDEGDEEMNEGGEGEGREIELDVEKARKGRTWEDCLAGWYNVKPYHIGRASHNCNGGFVVPPAHRQQGHAKILGRSYLHYAPRLGYRASVFSHVYANNTGSIRTWDSLGFTRIGRVPRAGRLRRADGKGEEWVDAIVFYKSLVAEEEWDTVAPVIVSQ